MHPGASFLLLILILSSVILFAAAVSREPKGDPPSVVRDGS